MTTNTHWQLTIPPIARSKQWQISSYIAPGNYNPEISAPAPVVKMIAVTRWEIFLYLMISWEWPHTHWFPPTQPCLTSSTVLVKIMVLESWSSSALHLPMLAWPEHSYYQVNIAVCCQVDSLMQFVKFAASSSSLPPLPPPLLRCLSNWLSSPAILLEKLRESEAFSFSLHRLAEMLPTLSLHELIVHIKIPR